MKKIIDCLRNDECGYKIENNLGFNAFDRVMRIAAKKEMTHKGLDKVLENLYFELYRLDGEDILDEERFYYIDDVDFDGIVTNPDGSQSLPMHLCMWDNRLCAKHRNRENAVVVPFSMRFITGRKCGWKWSEALKAAVLKAEEIREKREKVLRYKPIDDHTTIVTAPNNTNIEMNSVVANDVKGLIGKYGIEAYSVDVNRMTGQYGTINILNIHIENPEAMESEAFKDDFRELYTKAAKRDWDVYFISPGHSRNDLVETMFSKQSM